MYAIDVGDDVTNGNAYDDVDEDDVDEDGINEKIRLIDLAVLSWSLSP